MLSDIDNLDIMLGENHFNGTEREESLDSNLARRPESAISNNFENDDENMYSNPGNISSGTDANYGQNPASVNSSAEINRLSSELNSRLSRKLDEMMSSVSTQIQRAISDAITSQILPQIQNALNSGSGHLTQSRWNVSSERPEINSEEFRSEKTRENSRSEPIRDRFNDGITNHNVYDSIVYMKIMQTLIPEKTLSQKISV